MVLSSSSCHRSSTLYASPSTQASVELLAAQSHQHRKSYPAVGTRRSRVRKNVPTLKSEQISQPHFFSNTSG